MSAGETAVTDPRDDRDPYAEGVEAHRAGLPETANPYPEGSVEWAAWLDGWANGGGKTTDG